MQYPHSVFRYAIATGRATSDPAATLRQGVLRPPDVTNRATVPLKEFPTLLKALTKVDAELNTRLAKPYVKSNKNDAADAEAICEAVARPNMRFVPLKTMEQQAVLSVHRAS